MLTATERMAVAIDVVKRVGASRAKDGGNLQSNHHDNNTGYRGVDLPKGSRKYRARIRFNDCRSGQFVLLNLGRYDNADDAGYAYKVAHVAVWGAISAFVGEVTIEQIEAARAAGYADSTFAARGDNAGICG